MIESDLGFMRRALELARNGWYTTDPNPRVGCVLVKDEVIIAEGWHAQAGQAHAEVDALSKLALPDLARGATAYVTLEPCSHYGRTGPCCDALIAAGVSRVVAAMQDPNSLVAGNGLQKMREAGIEVVCGVLEADAAQLNRGFIKRMQTGMPFIISKLAMSLDGRTALANGQSQWITSPQSRHDVQRFRAESSAILTGIDTVLADDPSLNARVNFTAKRPARVILDSQLRMPVKAKMLQIPGETWLITANADPDKQKPLRDAGCKIFELDGVEGRIDLEQVFKLLAAQQINQVWVEAGATLNGNLLRSGLVDEWLIYMAPCVLGDQGRGLFHLPALQTMQDKMMLQLIDVRQIGPDLRLQYRTQSV